MKKNLAILLVMITLISLAACSDKPIQDNSTPIVTQEEIEFSEFQWPDSEIAGLLPVPESKKGKIDLEASYGFDISVGDTSKDQYNNYVASCETKGFTLDYQKGEDFYYADNEAGYHLSLKYKDNNTMFIRIDEPEAAQSVQKSEKVETDKISTTTQKTESTSSAETDKKPTPTEKAETTSSIETDKKPTPTEKAETTSSIETDKKPTPTEKAETTSSIETDKKPTPTEKTETTSSIVTDKKPTPTEKAETISPIVTDKKPTPTEKPDSSNDGISSDFKEAMDSYEEFFDEYVAFMKKYENSTDVEGMLADYNIYMTKYTDMMEKMDNINMEDWSNEETLYYIEVTNRITKKLTEIVQ